MRCVARFVIPFVLAVALPLSPVAFAEAFQVVGKVVSVGDGDTISIMHDGRAHKIRLNGIDCPEKRQAFGTRARRFTSAFVFGKTVTVTVVDVDRFGRWVGDVLLEDGRSLNRELVANGLAWWYRRYAPDNEDLAQLEATAREQGLGLWADPAPVPPWEWRRMMRPRR